MRTGAQLVAPIFLAHIHTDTSFLNRTGFVLAIDVLLAARLFSTSAEHVGLPLHSMSITRDGLPLRAEVYRYDCEHDPTNLLLFSSRDFWHYGMPARRNVLIAMAQCLRNPFPT